MINLVDIFGYLAVVLSAGTLVGQSFLLGGFVFLYWIAHPGTDTSADDLKKVRWFGQRWFRFSALGLAAVQVLYLYVNSAVLMASADIGFREAMGANFFLAGTVMLFAALMIYFIAAKEHPATPWFLALLVLTVLGASVMTDHAASRIEGRVPLIILTALHELGTGFWIGGLPFLLVGLHVKRDPAVQWYLTRRFSRIALISVIIIVVSGLFMSFSYIGSWGGLIGTSYGLMLLAKIAMLGAMLLLGGINFLMLRRHSPGETIPRLRRLVEAEVGIGLTIVLSAASMTAQPPAVDLPNDTVSPSHIYQRFKPEWPGLRSPNAGDLSTKIPGQVVSKNDPSRKTVAYTSEGMPLSIRKIADMRWSEYNHHWMGVIVLAMGILAFLARTGKAPWAEYWPLLMIAIGIFIFLRGDPECWPLGPKSFWSTWNQPEIFQHRAAALLCIAFAIFEFRVRRNPSQGGILPLLFPLLCAVGAALLLTHSHGTTNVREETLAELSHTPMAVLGVMAGWSRWLELRLPDENDRSLSAWIWPICFIIIGAGLMNYREL
jgi:copper resistance protein D